MIHERRRRRTEYNQPLITATIHRHRTHVVGSNMLESMKHCVAMGGTGLGATGGTPPADVMLRALAASGGIWNPVPGTDKPRSKNLLSDYVQYMFHVIDKTSET